MEKKELKALDWRAALRTLLQLLEYVLDNSLKAGMTLNKDTFRQQALAALNGGEFLARLTPTPRDDAAVRLLKHAFEDNEHFGDLCILLGIQ